MFSRYASYLSIDLGAADTRILAVAVIAGLSVLNYRGTRTGSQLQTGLTAAKLAVIAALVVGGFVMGLGLVAMGAPVYYLVHARR